MAGTVAAADDPRGLAALLRAYEQRLNRLETQVRGQNLAIDFPGRVRVKDAQGVTRFELGGFDNGGYGQQQYDPTGAPLKAAEQAQGNDPRTVSSTTYVDAGPALTVSAMAGPSGQLLVVLSALIGAQDPTITSSGLMSFASTGGRVTVAQDVNALQVSSAFVDSQTETVPATAGHTHGQAGETVAGGVPEHFHLMYPAAGPPALRYQRHSRVVLLPGCDPRTPVVVTAKYRVSNSSGPYLFDDRSLVVVPL